MASVTWKDVPMPAPHPPEFRMRAIAEARKGDKPVSQIAAELRISDSCLRNWLAADDVENGAKPGLAPAEKKELAELRKRVRQLEIEHEILKRAAALFA
ncbi:transposase, partial [Actinokineospora sp.]|uniref:transposase n=1 Tax=Actinokineospora sp. TaxID=1872133 RepID=UPI003D6B4004